MRGGRLNIISYRLAKQKEKSMEYKIDIPKYFNKVTQEKWIDLPQVNASNSELLASELAELIGEVLTKTYKWTLDHPEFKRVKDESSIHKIWLNLAKKVIESNPQYKLQIEPEILAILSKKIGVPLRRESINKIKDAKKEEDEKKCKEWKPHKTCKKFRCPNPETCNDPLCKIPAECKKALPVEKMKIVRADSQKPPSCPGKICRGSIITGRPADAWGTYEYEGYVLGKKRKIGKYTGWPVIYNYNNKFPWFGLFVMEKQAMTSDETKFKKWFNTYLDLHASKGKNDGRQKALASMRDKHKINVPQELVGDFPKKFESNNWRGGKKKSKKNIKMKMRKTRKGGSKTLTSLQKANIIKVINDKSVQQYVKEKKHKTMKLKIKLGGPKKFRSFTRKRKKRRRKNTGKRSRKRKKQRKYTCRKRKNCK